MIKNENLHEKKFISLKREKTKKFIIINFRKNIQRKKYK